MTDAPKNPNGRSSRLLGRWIGFALLAGAIGACVYLLSREAVLGGSRFLR